MITIKQKLYHCKRTKKLDNQLKIACQIYNHFITYQRKYYELTGKYCNLLTMQKLCTYLKTKEKYSTWKTLNAQCIQQILERIDNSYQLFFKEISKKKKGLTYRKIRPPKFKKEFKYYSLTFKESGISLFGNSVRVQKKYYKFHKTREISNVKTATFKRARTGDWYVCLTCNIPLDNPNKTMTGKIAGFDFGLKTFLTNQDGKQIKSPELLKNSLKLVRKASKNLSRKQKGSNNRAKARIKLAKVYSKIDNQRKDFQFKLAKKLCLTYDIIFLEKLNLELMKKSWGRKVSDLGFYQFVQILQHQGEKYGCKIKFIDQYYPSSKTCSNCDFINQNLTLRDRKWECSNCKIIHNRDENAAKNIFRVGTSTLTTDNVRPALAGCC